ncbi:MAG: relaxase/mobilization nuclease domain-containing protein [Sulfuritalea sp.]|nr:relaxase/mobilization nuclease domain-containing protein [Sulfuritalea sp.]MDP1984652.1 relaxase/mobilization nuclease domain-containing protein [Sulfuritalea sp.]
MISKIMKGSGFAGALNYVLSKDGAQMLGGNCAGGNARELANEMSQIADQNARCTKPVLHVSLGQPAGQANRLTDDQWQAVARDYLREMKIDPAQHQHVLVRHTDAGHDHVHLVINRVNSQNLRVLSDQNDRRRSMTACREIERRHQLSTAAEQGRGRHAAMRQAVFESTRESRGDFQRFAAALQKRGIDIKLNQASTGHVSGIVYQQHGQRPVKGSQLGKSYGWAGLSDRLKKSAEIDAAQRTKAFKSLLPGRRLLPIPRLSVISLVKSLTR